MKKTMTVISIVLAAAMQVNSADCYRNPHGYNDNKEACTGTGACAYNLNVPDFNNCVSGGPGGWKKGASRGNQVLVTQSYMDGTCQDGCCSEAVAAGPPVTEDDSIAVYDCADCVD